MTIEELKRSDADVIGRYVDLKRDGDRWKGCCPFHDDSTPSFVVYGDGKGWHCFGCDANGDVFDFIQRQEGLSGFEASKERVSELIGVEAPTTRRSGGPERVTYQPRVVAAYPYVDESGSLLYEVQRLEPKSFRQRRPDGNGGWMWGLGDVRRPLYRLPQVMAARELIVVEGEKDVHALELLGFTATTNSGGASQKWRDEWTETLAGKRVVIIPDADEPGRKHAHKIMTAIDESSPGSVIANLPDGYKDVSDFVADGGKASDIRKMIAEARKAAEEAAKPWWEKIPTLSELRITPIRWLIRDLIPDGGFVLMAGTPGSYKSFIALDIARAVATGQEFASMGPAVQREVLYVDLENPMNVIATRRNVLAIDGAEKLRYWGRWSDRPFFGIDAKELIDYARAVKPLIVFDSLVRFHAGNENDNSEMSKVMANFLAMAGAGATVLVLHHAGKDVEKNARGAIEIVGAPDLAYRVARAGDRLVTLTQFKNRFAEESTFDLSLGEYGFDGGKR